jgi:hypothetical protein
MGLTPAILRSCKSCHDEAMPILYGGNRFFFHGNEPIYAFRTAGLRRHACNLFSSMVGLDSSTTAGRFHYITNITIKAHGWEGEWEWFPRSHSNRNGLEQHSYPHLRVLNIDVTAHRHPPHKLLDVDNLLESVSDLEEICLKGVDILPLRLIGALRGVRSSEEQVTENNPCILKKGEGHWELLAGRKKPAE